jgi:hypothetical protein
MSMSLPSLLLPARLLLGAASAWAEPGKQTLDLECDYLPNVCNQPEDANPGLMIEIGSEAIRRAGFVPNVKIRPWVRAMREVLASPTALIIYFARTPERDPLFNWIVVTNTTDFRFFTRNGAEPCKHPAASHQSRSDRCAGWLKRAQLADAARRQASTWQKASCLKWPKC